MLSKRGNLLLLIIFYLQVTLLLAIDDYNTEKIAKWKSKKPTNILKKKYWMLDKKGRAEKEKPTDTFTLDHKEEDFNDNPKKKIKNEEDMELKDLPVEKFLKDEALQICETLSEDSVKDTLVKFGLVTKIISDVNKFRTTMKSLIDSMPVSKQKPGNTKLQKKKEERRLSEPTVHAVLDDYQPDYLGRSIQGLITPEFDELDGIYEGSNKLALGGDLLRDKRSTHKQGTRKRQARTSFLDDLTRKSRRKGTSKNFDQVPKCYGWRFLTAINSLTKEDSVDTEVLTQSVSDMLDMRFADSVTSIMENCRDTTTNVQGLCPPAKDTPEGRSHEECRNLCMVNEDCGYQEICCRQSCRNECVSVSGLGYNRCDQADRFMQCLYNMIDLKICD